MWVFWNAWHSTAFVSHNSDLCQIWERALGRAAFFKIWSCFSRQNKYGFDFRVIFEVVVCSCLCVVLWHKNLQRSFLGTVQAELECHLILLVKLESFKGSPQVQVDGRKLFPCLLARNLWCLSAESDGASVTVVVIKFPAGVEALNCVCTFEIRGLFLSFLAYLSEKRFTFLTQISQKKTHFAFGRLALCSVWCAGKSLDGTMTQMCLLPAVPPGSLGQGVECQRGLRETGRAGEAEQRHSETDRVLPAPALQEAPQKGKSPWNGSLSAFASQVPRIGALSRAVLASLKDRG